MTHIVCAPRWIRDMHDHCKMQGLALKKREKTTKHVVGNKPIHSVRNL